VKKIVKYVFLSSAAVALSSASYLAHAHGYTTYPSARQQTCKNDGGYWWPTDGSGIPNAACRAAFLESGNHPFQQSNQFAVLTPDFNNQQAVQNNIQDGTLCAAGLPNNAGMDIVSPDWQKTRIALNAEGKFKYTYRATAAHSPHFWKFYLTKPGFNPNTDTLTWDALELIQEHGNIAVDRGHYEMEIQIPAGRSGDAILYTHWQRIDPAGEGFYNCSDITLVGNGEPVDPVDPVATWHALDAFVDNGFVVNAQDQVWFRVFSAAGQEVVFEKQAITAANATSEAWADALAQQVNDQHAAIVQIGVRDAAGNIAYDPQDLYANKVWAQQANYNYELDVKAFKPTLQISGLRQEYALSNGQVSIAATLQAVGEFGVRVDLSSGQSQTLALQNNTTVVQFTVTDAGEYELTVSPDNHLGAQTSTFTVRDAVSGESTWEAGKVYAQPCASVTHNGQDWHNQWWTRGDEPGSQAWGPWRLASDQSNNNCR